MGSLQKFEPFRDLWNWSDDFGKLFWNQNPERNVGFVPAVDLAEDNDTVTIKAEVPGLRKEDIKIKVRNGILTLSGEKKFQEEKREDNYYRIERSYGSFARSFTLPSSVDPDGIKANMKDGVLELVIPKKPEAKEKEINVDVD